MEPNGELVNRRRILPTLAVVLVLLLSGCGDEAVDGPDGLTVIDTGTSNASDAESTDAMEGGGDDVATALPDKCKSDKDCIAFDAVCDKSVKGGRCVQCLQDGDCLGNSERCIANVCKEVDLCKSDKACLPLGKVCNKAAGVCVECLASADCGAEQLCKAFACVDKPKSCKSSKDCSSEGKVCNKKLSVCVECIADLDCDVGSYCNVDVCATWVCKPAQTACTPDAKLKTCKDDGSGWTVSVCSGGKDCVNGACQATVCAAGSKVCQDGKLGTCSADGTKVEGLVACKSGETCVKDKCVGGSCSPGQKTCIDAKTVGTCQANGKDYEFSPCKAPNVCEAGACKAKICDPGKVFCKDGNLMLCSGSGGGAETGEDCKAKGLTCKSGKCVKAGACTAGEVLCTADKKATKTCKADGSGFVQLSCPAGWICLGKKCQQLICDAGALYCADNDVKKCGIDGTSAKLVAACGVSKQCAQGACISNKCTPGATVCLNKTMLLTCQASGIGYLSSACTSACSGGKCS